MAMVGAYRIDGSVICHVKSDKVVATLETGVEDPAPMILEAVETFKRVGPFIVSRRGSDFMLMTNDKHPLDALSITRAALAAVRAAE
ncbi:MAG: hypothetical protein AAFY80_06990 [Pseudomonadota bacterium]